MSKSFRFALATVWILLSRSYDAYCTNQLTPDLSKESNPLVSVFGLSWTPLLLVLSVLTLYAIYVAYLVAFKPMNLLPREKGYSFGEVTAFTYFGTLGSSRTSKRSPVIKMFYSIPKDLHRFNQYMGHTLTQCLVYAGIVSTVMWLLIRHTSFYAPFHNVYVIYTLLIGGCAAIIYTWHKRMYAEYLNRARVPGDENVV